MTTKTTKIADRYAALASIAQTLDGVAFTPAKKPTTKDCEELSAMIDAHRAALAVTVAVDESGDEDGDAPEAIAPKTTAAVDERAAAIEAKRAEARRRFETATKATTAHGYALIAAATADGDRMENLRAKLAEMPEAVRAGACRLAAEKLVQPGSTMQMDLRRLYDEQPAIQRSVSGGGGGGARSRSGVVCCAGNEKDRYIAIRVKHLPIEKGAQFSIEHVVDESGKHSFTLRQI